MIRETSQQERKKEYRTHQPRRRIHSNSLSGISSKAVLASQQRDGYNLVVHSYTHA